MSDTLQSSLQIGRLIAARRPGAELRVRLTTRRAWFADPPAETPQDGEGQGETPADKPKLPDGAPDWIADPDKAWKEVQKLRAENARKRVESKPEPKPKAEEPPTDSDRIAALENQLRESNLKAMRLEIAAEVGLPKALAARLQGDDEEALRADAEALKALIPEPPSTPAAKDDKKPASTGRQTSTTTVPNGQAAQPTPQQMRDDLYNRGARAFEGGGVRYLGNPADLDAPVG